MVTLSNIAPVTLGSVEPRIFTAPLRPLTPETSSGFALIDWVDANLDIDLLPHQRWLFQHLGELLPSGLPRFRTAGVVMGRQNAKTTTAAILALHTMQTPGALVLGTSAALATARDAWKRACLLAMDLDEYRKPRESNGTEELSTLDGARYLIKATNPLATRGYSVDLLVLDELAALDFEGWAATSKTTNARPAGLRLCLGTGPLDSSEVQLHLREVALSGADPSVGWFEWSADPNHCGLLQCRECWAAANPALGHTISEATLASDSATDPPNLFRREVLCQRQVSDSGLVDPDGWAAGADAAGTLDSARGRVFAGLDVSPDLLHVSLAVAATLPDGRTRVELAGAWSSPGEARKELPGLLKRVRPRSLSVAPGPGATLGPDLIPFNPTVATSAALADACVAFVELVGARQLLHGDDPLLTAHVLGAQRKSAGSERYLIERSGGGHVDSAIAAALAVRASRSQSRKPLRLVTTKT